MDTKSIATETTKTASEKCFLKASPTPKIQLKEKENNKKRE